MKKFSQLDYSLLLIYHKYKTYLFVCLNVVVDNFLEYRFKSLLNLYFKTFSLL